MIDQTPMIFLAVVLLIALGITAYLTLGSWRSSRTPTRQIAPELATKRWLNREARNARNDREPSRHPF
jgi:hypothetical protein